MDANDVVITGIGLVSSVGEGAEAHWRAMSTPGIQPRTDGERFPPYTIHPMPEIDWTPQIPKRGDQRQMENWQRLGTYTAGLALDDARMKGDEGLCGTMDMVIAAAGGERDQAVDLSILEASLTRNDRDVLLNERLMTDLRPTLFLAQLSNLLAGNISIVHKVTGSSRTFMGEEGSGISAVETAAARIRSGQSTHALVGGAFQTEHTDMLLGYELAGYLHRGPWTPVWSRAGSQGGGIVTGSGAAFLILEARQHAEQRGARVYARLSHVAGERISRTNGRLSEGIAELFSKLMLEEGPLLAVSGASGAHAATAAEQEALRRLNGLVPRAFSTVTGHVKEAQFPFAIALAALAVSHGQAYPPFDASEPAFEEPVRSALATTIGYHRFEGAALVTAA